MSDQPAPYTCKHGCERDALKDTIERQAAEIAERDATIRRLMNNLQAPENSAGIPEVQRMPPLPARHGAGR